MQRIKPYNDLSWTFFRSVTIVHTAKVVLCYNDDVCDTMSGKCSGIAAGFKGGNVFMVRIQSAGLLSTNVYSIMFEIRLSG